MSEFTLTTMASAAITALVVILVFGGVVLPAVWSRDRTRRAAATEVLRQLLDFFRARPGGDSYPAAADLELSAGPGSEPGRPSRDRRRARSR